MRSVLDRGVAQDFARLSTLRESLLNLCRGWSRLLQCLQDLACLQLLSRRVCEHRNALLHDRVERDTLRLAQIHKLTIPHFIHQLANREDA